MSKTRWLHIAVILAFFVILLIFLFSVRSILPPFLIAFGIAWLLNPIADRLQERGAPRILAVTAVFATFLTILIVGMVFLVPMVIEQGKQLAHDIPSYTDRLQVFAQQTISTHEATLRKLNLPTTLHDVFSRYGDRATDGVTLGVQHVSKWIVSNLSLALWLVLIPLSAFYFLNDMSRIRARMPLLVPEEWRPRVVDVASRMGLVFSSYVRGLVMVCAMFGTVTMIALTGFSVEYSIILGLMAGILYAIPYLGAMIMTLVVFLVDLATNGLAHAIGMVAVMVILNQIMFDMIITPRVLGRSVGLHPVLSLFALISAGKLLGLPGMVLAVPLAASIQEIVLEFYPELRNQTPEEVPAKKLSWRIKWPKRRKK